MESAFLKHITDEPDDTVARLVFADWLREQDAPALNERGEFIHLQHALAGSDVRPEERKSLLARQKELLTRYREQWEEPFRGMVKNCQFRLGFADRVTLSVEQFVVHFAEVVERTPVVRVRLTGLTPDAVDVIAAMQELNRIRELALTHHLRISLLDLRRLLASPHLTRLRSLNLAHTGIGDEGVRMLVASPVFDQLQYLNLSRTRMSTEGVRALVNAIYSRNLPLQMLVLRGAPRLQPDTFPPIPPGWPLQLRQSLQSQIGLDPTSPPDLLSQLYASPARLSNELRQWVEWLRKNGHTELPRAVKVLPLPDPLRDAFTLVCERRVLWRAKRLGTDRSALPRRERRVLDKARQLEATLPALPLTADGRTDLTEILKILIGMTDPDKEARVLTECLLDLYLRHERGELPPDGKTR